MSWSLWRGSPDEWDASLLRLPDYTVYQSHAWGEHKRRSGWQPIRLSASDQGETIAMAQVLVRRIPLGGAFAWITGGPVGRIDAWDDSFRRMLIDASDARMLYCRLNAMRPRGERDVQLLTALGWMPAQRRMLSGLSLSYSLVEDEPARRARASGNWRHNLKRSTKYGHSITVWQNPDPDEMLSVYEAMQTHKDLPQQITRAELSSILEAFGPRCVVVRCDDSSGKLLAVRGALLLGEKGWDSFAAATPKARSVYASHGAFWELMGQCASRGVRGYDMGGVDPVGNKGVYDFKKGTGADELTYLGEWDWATSRILRRASDYLIQRRLRAGTAG